MATGRMMLAMMQRLKQMIFRKSGVGRIGLGFEITVWLCSGGRFVVV